MKASEQFKVGKNNISYVSNSFGEWFGGMEFEPSDAKLIEWELAKDMTDEEIFAALRPEDVQLGNILSFLKNANKKKWYIFYTKDKSGVRRAVHVFWYDFGWNVYAYSVTRPDELYAGYHVVSRKFSDPQPPPDTLALCISDMEKVLERMKKLQDN